MAEHPNADEELFEGILDHALRVNNPLMQTMIARHPKASPSILAQMKESGWPGVLNILASREDIDADTLAVMATYILSNWDFLVGKNKGTLHQAIVAVAKHALTTPELLVALLGNPVSHDPALSNPKFPQNLILSIAHDCSVPSMDAIAINPSTTANVLDVLVSR